MLFPYLAAAAVSAPAAAPIDRHALVTRHNIRWDALDGQMPLGNGEFCFSADGTGLQTFGGSALAHWAWHTAPLPPGCTPRDVPATGTLDTGRIAGGMKAASGRDDLDGWMFRNPHPANLCRLRFVRGDGSAIDRADVRVLERTLDLWTGLHRTRFSFGGDLVEVDTCVHPGQDAVAVRASSPALAQGRLAVCLDFPYPNADPGRAWCGSWDRGEAHTTAASAPAGRRVDIARQADDTRYTVRAAWGAGCRFGPHPGGDQHAFVLRAGPSGTVEMSCSFAASWGRDAPTFAAAAGAAVGWWKRHWSRGGAIDLSGSVDPRWRELERRIVLSQYQVAVNSAGSWPPAECGLTTIDAWAGQFHMEMVWWHLAHYALWDRLAMSDRALGCYRAFLPTARSLAAQLGYRGAKWGKQVGPEGRTAPWVGSFVLGWQQPHPIFFAELEYRVRPTRATLEKWRDIVIDTADYMADFPTRGADGLYHLDPIMPPSEQGITRDTVFDLAYWRWGLDAAQTWRRRLGMAPEPRWAEVRSALAPLPTAGGAYVHSAEWHDTYEKRAWEHPDPIGALGMLPPTDGLDPTVSRATLDKVWRTWDWRRCWGWDFPWMAMAAARLGRTDVAVDALLKDAGDRNRYDERGINTGGPCPYLPGNGGLLYAVAMMAAGWDGAPAGPAPGFPSDGRWTVRWEGLKRAP